MTISTSYTWELRRDQLITRSLQVAGVLHAAHTPGRELIDLGKDLLQMELSALQADGILLHAIERYSQALADGVASYLAPADTLDVEDGAIVRSTAGYDTPITKIAQVDYNRRGVKTTTGQPTEYMAEKNTDGTTTVYLFPIPTAESAALIYPRVRRLRDSDSGTVSIDVPVKFTEAVTLKLAARFCRHLNRDAKAKALLEEYADAHERVMNDETQRGPVRFMVEPLFWGR